MSLGHGANIVKDGLVFAYDMGSKQSWKGRPTTNLWAANKSTYSWTTGTGTVTRNIPSSEIKPPFSFTGGEVVKVENTSDSFGTILWTVPGITGPSVTYAHSIWVYLVRGDSVGIGQHWNPWTYNHLRYPAVGKWERIEHINTTVDNTHTSVAIQYNVNKVGGGGIAYFYAPQYELGPCMTEFVNGTRSNTQSIIDWKGKNTITATSLIYNSDNTFSFDGTTQDNRCVVTAGSELSALKGSSNISVEAWVYYRSYSGGTESYSVITCWGSPWVWLLENPSNTLRFRITAGGSDVNIADTSTHPLNEWIHVVGTYDGTTKKIYVNGKLKNSSSQTGVLGSPGGSPVIGSYQGTNYCMSGDISSIKIYNKALTAAEVKQNFNALRGRFGI